MILLAILAAIVAPIEPDPPIRIFVSPVEIEDYGRIVRACRRWMADDDPTRAMERYRLAQRLTDEESRRVAQSCALVMSADLVPAK